MPYAVNDGQFHKYSFDWHTGDVGESKRVDFYVDDIYICSSTKNVPSNASRFWIGIWFPCAIDSNGDDICDTGWTGTANFDTTVFEIDSVKITPYLEAGDTVQNESVPKSGWEADSFPEDIEAEHFDHVVNGDFSLGQSNWELNGDASISNGKAYLTSGSKTDTVKQVVNVLPKMTYTLAADVITGETIAEIGVRNLNGTNNVSQTITENGQAVIQFTTKSGVTQVELYAQVKRYQESSTPAIIDNISFISGKEPAYESELEPIVPSPREPTLEPDEPASINLIKNGSFDNGSENWEISGSATVDTAARLASGSDTDSISQIVAVEGGETYTLSADVQTEGTEVIIGVKDYNGRYTEYSETVNSSNQVVLTFETASHIEQIEVFAKVLRYQSSNNQAIVDNITLVKGDTSPILEPEQPEEPENPVPESNLIKNGSFDDLSEWTLSGNATINSGKLSLDSGLNTDTAKQIISVEPNTTYKINADIISSGCVVDIKVSDYNGRYSSIVSSYDSSCQGELVFTTGSSVDTITITFQVLRYQGNNDAVMIDDVIMERVIYPF